MALLPEWFCSMLTIPMRPAPGRLRFMFTPMIAVLAISAESSAQDRSEKPRPSASEAERKDDRAAIRASMDSFVKAFISRDPKSLAAHWTEEGEYRNQDGLKVHGRESLEKGFAEFFAHTPEISAEVHPDTLTFLARDIAIEEGTVTVRRGAAAPPSSARYTVLLVREDGRWQFARLEESPDDDQSVENLAWLVGDWKSEIGQGAEIRTTYTWSPSKKFINGQFKITENNRTLSGHQVIGVDPAVGAVHSWTFEADGGVSEADWNRDGDQWVLDAEGTLTDGSTLAQTNILTRINDDTFTWQSVDRMLGDDKLPDLAPVKVVRVKPAK